MGYRRLHVGEVLNLVGSGYVVLGLFFSCDELTGGRYTNWSPWVDGAANNGPEIINGVSMVLHAESVVIGLLAQLVLQGGVFRMS